MTLQCAIVKNSPSKLEGAPEGEEVCLAAKVILWSVVYYKVDSIISSYLLFIFTDPHQWRNAEWRFLLLIIYTSFHIFASVAIGDGISIYAKMLKSTAY